MLALMEKLFSVFIFINYCLFLVNCNKEKTSESINNIKDFLDYYEQFVNFSESLIALSLNEESIGYSISALRSMSLSKQCNSHLSSLLFGLMDSQLWALKVLDSFGKIPSGIFSGTLSSFGDFDQCLGIKIVENEMNPFIGKYCLLRIRPYLPPKNENYNTLLKSLNKEADQRKYSKESPIRTALQFYFTQMQFGLCVPASCDEDDLKSISQTCKVSFDYLLYLHYAFLSVSFYIPMNFSLESCQTLDSRKLETEQIIGGVILILVILFLSISTIIDIIIKNNSKKHLFSNIVKSASVYRNIVQFNSYENKKETIQSVYLIRVISLFWVILAHAYVTLDLKSVNRLLEIRPIVSFFLFQIVLNASLALEALTFLSGLTITYSLLKQHLINPKEIKFIQWIYIFFRRWIRITIPAILVISLAFIIVPFYNGPLWPDIVENNALKCSKYWWTHLIHLNNFLPYHSMCFPHLFYCAINIQLFILIPFVITLLYRSPRHGKVLIAVLVIIFMLVTIFIIFIKHLPPTILFSSPDPTTREAFIENILLKPWSYIPSYLIGILVGYLLSNDVKIHLSTFQTVFCWILSLSCLISFMFLTYPLNQEKDVNGFWVPFFIPMTRIIWTLSVAWFVIACQWNRSGLLNKISGWSFFKWLSKLSYVSFLIHPSLMSILVASSRNLFFLDNILMLKMFMLYLSWTILFAWLLCPIIEIPFIKLASAYFMRFQKKNINAINSEESFRIQNFTNGQI